MRRFLCCGCGLCDTGVGIYALYDGPDPKPNVYVGKYLNNTALIGERGLLQDRQVFLQSGRR